MSKKNIHDPNFFQSTNTDESAPNNRKKVSISLLKNEHLNLNKQLKQTLGENYDDTYTESPSISQTPSRKLV